MKTSRSLLHWLGSAALTLSMTGCQSMLDDAYYGTWERFGVEKRDILRDRVEDGRQDQRTAQEQFKTTYERFKEVSGYDGGDLERAYTSFRREFERSESRAQDVRDRIASIEKVADDLFSEWSGEIQQISSASLRRDSQSKLTRTQKSYDQLIETMKRAERKMEPVLTVFRDRVLYLKHNLNAQAISSLGSSAREIESDVASLLRDMDASIREADAFLATIPES